MIPTFVSQYTESRCDVDLTTNTFWYCYVTHLWSSRLQLSVFFSQYLTPIWTTLNAFYDTIHALINTGVPQSGMTPPSNLHATNMKMPVAMLGDCFLFTLDPGKY